SAGCERDAGPLRLRLSALRFHRHDKESITVLKLGYKASAEQFAPTKLLDFAVQAEAVGFDSAFVSDHFQPWKHVDGHAPYSLAWLGALGARTSRLGIGTGESLNEVPSTGQPWPEFKERFARMREAVTLIRTLWRGERISFEG